MIKGLIFDLDGTILSTETDLCTAINQMRAFFNLSPLSQETVKSNLGNGIRLLVTRSLDIEYHEHLEQAIELFHTYYAECFNDTTHPYEAVYETLKHLQLNYRLSVVSNKAQKYVDLLIEAHFPELHFDCIYGDADNHKRKPDPQGIIESMYAMNCYKRELLLIGDSVVDCETALNFDIAICPVAWGFQSRDRLYDVSKILPIEKITDLILFIDQLNYN